MAARRVRRGDRDGAAAHHEGGLEARPRRFRPQGGLDGEGAGLGDAAQGDRQARLVDGASEVHKMVLARNYLAEGGDFWAWR
jgi:hypothetical protein